MTTAFLRADRLVVRLGGRRVVDGVSVDLHGRQWTAIVGPNGAGKSTLLTVLAGLRPADEGSVLLHGRPLAEWPARERARGLAWMSQQGEAEGDLAARDVVRLGRLPHHGLFGAPDVADEAAVDAAMAETESTAYATRRLSDLSGGERQRVLLARVLAGQAKVLLLDEPTTHLDAPHQSAVMRTLASLARGGATVLSVLHDLSLSLCADRVLVMVDGRLSADGPPADAALRGALIGAFGGALTIEAFKTGGLMRWIAIPAL